MMAISLMHIVSYCPSTGEQQCTSRARERPTDRPMPIVSMNNELHSWTDCLAPCPIVLDRKVDFRSVRNYDSESEAAADQRPDGPRWADGSRGITPMLLRVILAIKGPTLRKRIIRLLPKDDVLVETVDTRKHLWEGLAVRTSTWPSPVA